MKVLQGKALSECIRSLSDACKSKIRIASPYIGNWMVVECLLGNSWWKRAEVSISLLTDEHAIHAIGKRTVARLANRTSGSNRVRSISGLHAKLYVFDDLAVVTSANFTTTAFTRRREAGVLLEGADARAVVEMFDSWFDTFGVDIDLKLWKAASDPNGQPGEEPGSNDLPLLEELPVRAPITLENTEEQNNEAYLQEYRELVDMCVRSGRISSPDVSMYIEVDTFLYFLHDEGAKPSSKNPKHTSGRPEVTASEQAELFESLWQSFREWTMQYPSEIIDRAKEHDEVASLLSRSRISTLSKDEIGKILRSLHCYRKRNFHPKNILLKNSVPDIKRAWKDLLYGTGNVDARLKAISQELQSFGHSGSRELLGWSDPWNFPIRNNKSDAGLRYLGLKV